MKTSYPPVTIITVNFNGKKYLKRLFDSISRLKYPKNKIKVSDLDLALGELEQLKPLAKQQLLRACVASIEYDRITTAVEVDVLRAFAGALDCPMPSGTA